MTNVDNINKLQTPRNTELFQILLDECRPTTEKHGESNQPTKDKETNYVCVHGIWE
jgi:hypothetical protein